MSRALIQIVPRRSAAPEGVGDYSRLLAEQLQAQHDVRTIFIAGTPLPPEQRLHDMWETHEVPRRTTRALTDALAATGGNAGVPVLLHLSAYGFQDKGVPLWLAAALERWRRANPATPLVTVFHELYATGPVWRSAFWIGPVQAKVAKRIQAIGTAAIATTSSYTDTLKDWSGDTALPAITLPVFSTVGERHPITLASDRHCTLVIFGRAGIYKTVYQDSSTILEAFVRATGIKKIIDIGARPHQPPMIIGNARVCSLGEISAPQLLNELAQARFGLLHYDADRLAKSSIFASYCANGIIPVCLTDSEGHRDGLEPSHSYLRLTRNGIDMAPITDAALDELQSRATSWYRPHSLQASADRIAGILYPISNQADPRVPCC